MKVIPAFPLGYCMGVRRAVEMALRASGDPPVPGLYTLGPLIHNPQVLDMLSRRGLKILDEAGIGTLDSGELRGAVVIIRAHGIRPDLEEELKKRGARILDATCPKVKASQTLARSLAGEGYILFLAGEERHGEIAGILGYARQGVPPDGPGLEAAPGESAGCVVVANPREAAAAAEAACRRMGDRKGPAALIAQTTISPEEYRAIGEEILKFFPGLRICDTICGATRDRQDALKELCRSVDAVIVAGGRESANTRRLLSLAQARDKPAWLVEKVGDIPPEIAAYGTVGLSAGASTPDELIDGIRRALENFLPQGRAGRANH